MNPILRNFYLSCTRFAEFMHFFLQVGESKLKVDFLDTAGDDQVFYAIFDYLLKFKSKNIFPILNFMAFQFTLKFRKINTVVTIHMMNELYL